MPELKPLSLVAGELKQTDGTGLSYREPAEEARDGAITVDRRNDRWFYRDAAVIADELRALGLM